MHVRGESSVEEPRVRVPVLVTPLLAFYSKPPNGSAWPSGGWVHIARRELQWASSLVVPKVVPKIVIIVINMSRTYVRRRCDFKEDC